jgi:hypothetical protein
MTCESMLEIKLHTLVLHGSLRMPLDIYWKESLLNSDFLIHV